MSKYKRIELGSIKLPIGYFITKNEYEYFWVNPKGKRSKPYINQWMAYRDAMLDYNKNVTWSKDPR